MKKVTLGWERTPRTTTIIKIFSTSCVHLNKIQFSLLSLLKGIVKKKSIKFTLLVLLCGQGRSIPFFHVNNRHFHKVSVGNFSLQLGSNEQKSTTLCLENALAVAFTLRFAAGMCSNQFGSFSITTCVQKLPLVLPKIEVDNLIFATRRVSETHNSQTHRQTDMA